MEIKHIKSLVVVDGVNAVVPLDDFTQLYVVTGTPTLTSNWAITASGTPQDNMVCTFFWKARPVFGGNTVSIFGINLPVTLSGKEFTAVAVYKNSEWSLSVSSDLVQPGGGAGIVYGDITLTNSIVNGDISSSAGIEKTKLNLVDGIVNADINSAAGLAFTKMEALTVSRALVTDGTGNVGVSTTTATELEYVSGVTSALQTQIDAKLSEVVNANINAAAAIAFTKMEALTANRAIILNASGKVEASAITDTELEFLLGVTSTIQDQLNAKVSKALTLGYLLVGDGSSETTGVNFSVSGQIPVGDGTTLNSVSITGDATLASTGVLTLAANAATPSKANVDMRRNLVTINASFETGYTGEKKIRVPHKSQLIHMYVCVEKAIGAADDGALKLKDHVGTNMAGGSLITGELAIPLSSAAGTILQTDVDTNNAFAAGETMILETRKTTAGGTMWVSLTFEKID